MSLNHGRGTAPPVRRICSAKMACLVPVCFALPGEGCKASFSGLHFDAFMGSANIHQETHVLLLFGLRAEGLTDIRHSWIKNFFFDACAGIYPADGGVQNQTGFAIVAESDAQLSKYQVLAYCRVQVSGEAQAFHEVVVQLLLDKLRHYVRMICG